jgi:hypothetical protein
MVKTTFLITNLKRKKQYKQFIKKYYHLSENSYRTIEELKKSYPKYNCYITGSDQVWNTTITNGLQDAYTLNFGNEKIIKISYAASVGKSDISSEEWINLKNKIEFLNAISVREESAKEQLQKVLDKKIEITLDPTLLLKKKDWDEFSGERIVKEKYILVYAMENNPEVVKIVNYLSENTNLKVVHFDKKSKYNNPLRSFYVSGPKEFVNLIKNAELVVTNSFHGTVFSVIFEKKFYTIPHTTKGSRMIDLLNKLKLTDRIFYNIDEFKKINKEDLLKKLDYKITNEILETERNKSILYLEKNLKD